MENLERCFIGLGQDFLQKGKVMTSRPLEGVRYERKVTFENNHCRCDFTFDTWAIAPNKIINRHNLVGAWGNGRTREVPDGICAETTKRPFGGFGSCVDGPDGLLVPVVDLGVCIYYHRVPK